MCFRKLYAVLISASLFISTGIFRAIPVYASNDQIIASENPEFMESDLAEILDDVQLPSESMPDSADSNILEQVSEIQPDAVPEVVSTNIEPENLPDSGSRDDDLSPAAGQGISFRLFNYSTDINKTQNGTAWREISRYFTFRNSKMEISKNPADSNIPDPNINEAHDQDGFPFNHATVERLLDNGYPVLDLSRNADGSARTDPGVSRSTRNLKYLFSSGDHAVTAYTPYNTILQKNGNHYWYDSADHAIDFDIPANQFRLRSYAERNDSTAAYGERYGDFLPFTYTGGIVQGKTDDGAAYHVKSADVDYWFGMLMQVDFFQTKGGLLGSDNSENMVFHFSGDDDVWVFVDDVLVLDLGGTHGTVNGSIDFATGEVLQYLSWGGKNESESERKNGSETSFPTTIRACFDAAGRTPNGGWSEDGQTFADFTEHTLKFFYLERGATAANCSLDFRLPTLPDESLTISKDISVPQNSQKDDFVAEGVDYCFRVMKADESGNGTDEPFLTSGMVYDLLENGEKIGTGIVGEDNCFQLKAGQSAQFTQMLLKGNGATNYVVEELIPQTLVDQYSEVTYQVGSQTEKTAEKKDGNNSIFIFQSGTLSAQQTHTVTFRNYLDIAKLGTLRITKRAAAGTQIPKDMFFKMQVTVGGSLLPIGTSYQVGTEYRTVDTPGILLLRVDETAILENLFLAGVQYQVSELLSTADGYRPAYTGSVEPSGTVICDEKGANGIFSLDDNVEITVTNADYDFAIEIPLKKQVLDFQKESTFYFEVEQVENIDGSWRTVKTFPETAISVSGDQIHEERITIGYPYDAEGIFHYRITERRGTENYLYDDSVFLVEVTVSGASAGITAIKKNESAVEQVLFMNQTVTELTVTKTLTGGGSTMKFPFTATVYLDDVPFDLPATFSNERYTVNGNTISFSLAHGESITISCIPARATVVVTEHNCDGFLVLNEVEGVLESQINSSVRELHFSGTPQTLHFTNQTGFRLPNTGGEGMSEYTAGGLVLLALGILLIYTKRKKQFYMY